MNISQGFFPDLKRLLQQRCRFLIPPFVAVKIPKIIDHLGIGRTAFRKIDLIDFSSRFQHLLHFVFLFHQHGQDRYVIQKIRKIRLSLFKSFFQSPVYFLCFRIFSHLLIQKGQIGEEFKVISRLAHFQLTGQL